MPQLPKSPWTPEALKKLRDAAPKEPVSSRPFPAPLTNEQLAALRSKTVELGRMLTDSERDIVLFGKVQPKISHGMFVK